MTVAAPVPAASRRAASCTSSSTRTARSSACARPFSFWDVRHPEGAWTKFDLVYRWSARDERMTRKEPWTPWLPGPLGRASRRPRRRAPHLRRGRVGIVPFHISPASSGRRPPPRDPPPVRRPEPRSAVRDRRVRRRGREGPRRDRGRSRGDRGLVTDLLSGISTRPVRIYTCGPDRDRPRGADRPERKCLEVSMEQRMAAGWAPAGLRHQGADGATGDIPGLPRGPAYDASALVLEEAPAQRGDREVSAVLGRMGDRAPRLPRGTRPVQAGLHHRGRRSGLCGQGLRPRADAPGLAGPPGGRDHRSGISRKDILIACSGPARPSCRSTWPQGAPESGARTIALTAGAVPLARLATARSHPAPLEPRESAGGLRSRSPPLLFEQVLSCTSTRSSWR